MSETKSCRQALQPMPGLRSESVNFQMWKAQRPESLNLLLMQLEAESFGSMGQSRKSQRNLEGLERRRPVSSAALEGLNRRVFHDAQTRRWSLLRLLLGLARQTENDLSI